MIKQQHLRITEFLLLYAGIPLILIGEPRGIKITALWILCLLAITLLRRHGIRDAAKEWNWGAVRAGMPMVLKRFVPCAIALTLLLFWLQPSRFLSFPLERPGMWVIVMICYPIMSVLPQELIYRSLYHHRYAKLFSGEKAQMLVAGVSFSVLHIMFLNWVSPLLCFVAGIMFSQSYMKHKSLALVVIEHALYGCFIFTLGLGVYFYGVTAAR